MKTETKMITKAEAKQLSYILNDKITKTSDWTRGSGKHTSSKKIPPFCSKESKNLIVSNVLESNISAINRHKRIKEYFLKHPRVQAVIVVDDMENAVLALQEHGYTIEKKDEK